MGIFSSIFTKKDIGAYTTKSYELNKLKELTQILVVDDDAAAFPVSLLQSEGYRITYWPKIENLTQIERGDFDIIILDISGVAQRWSPEEDGLSILRMVKRSNPGQYIISFSGQKSVHQLKDFWTLSDDQLKKPATAEDCKSKLDFAMKERVNVGHYWNRVREMLLLNGATPKLIRRMEKRIVDQTREGDRSGNTLRNIASVVIRNEKVQDLAVTLAIKAIVAALL